jgi:hypothetical protein
MTGADTGAAIRRLLDDALAGARPLDAAALATLAAAPAATLEQTLRDFADEHGTAALPALTALAAAGIDREVRRSARRALYRLSQRGVARPTAPPPRAVVERRTERATRAWLSGIDGTGSRAAWILFEDGWGGAALCSLIINDTVGIVEVAGGQTSRKRLERELAALRASQKLPWIEVEPERAVALVGEALALHRARGTTPPAAFAPWEPRFSGAPPPSVPAMDADPALAERAAELFDLPELAGWFLDPEAVQADALELLQARESRLVLSDQLRSEREEAIVARVVERELDPPARRRWARRLHEMGFVLARTGRTEAAGIAHAAAARLADDARPVRHDAFARALARRGLDVAGEVASGRMSAADVSRRPGAA